MSETQHETETIDALEFDHTLMCEARSLGCGGANPAEYLAVHKHPCCKQSLLICSACVARKISLDSVAFRCSTCWSEQSRWVGRWLDRFTLHPLGGTP